MKEKAYLGDSVYVEMDFEAGGLVLTTENGLPNDPSNRIVLDLSVWQALVGYVERVVLRNMAQPDKPKAAAIPKDPSPGLLMSMAIRYDHGLGVPGHYDQPMFAMDGVTHKQRLECMLSHMRQVHEEVSGRGFYSPEKEEDYVAQIIASGVQP